MKLTNAKKRHARRAVVLFAWLVSMLVATAASALPKVGSARPGIVLVDGWDRAFDLAKVERPLLLIYEDEGSSAQNQTLKDELIKLEQSRHYRKSVAHLVVADVSAYDYWPAKGIAKGELQKWSQKLGIVIYGDFSGQAKKKLQVDAGKSNVVFYSSDGKVLFSHSGPLTQKDRAELLDLVKDRTRSVGAGLQGQPPTPAAGAAGGVRSAGPQSKSKRSSSASELASRPVSAGKSKRSSMSLRVEECSWTACDT